jgi:hypothetical protein
MANKYRRTKKCGPARKIAKKKLAEDEVIYGKIRRPVVRTGSSGQSVN